jgi:hypothetical protein
MSIELMEWQRRVVYGNEQSLLVSAGFRSGKDVAVAHAMKERRTLVLCDSYNLVSALYYGANHYGTKGFYADIIDRNFYKNYKRMFGFFSQFEQIIFHEPCYRAELKAEEKVELIRETRKTFNGRIVVIGTPREKPDSVFAPLAMDAECPFLWDRVNPESPLEERYKRAFKRILSAEQYEIQVLGQWA